MFPGIFAVSVCALALNMLSCSPLLISQVEFARAWYAVPLIVVVSLVYGATRHEYPREIMIHSFRSAVWVVGFMGVIFAIIYVAGFWN
jgi:hypothetical protein